MTLTKIVGGFCGALLVLLLGKWAAETLYHVGGHHGEEVAVYVIEVEDSGSADEAVEEINFDTLIETADAAKGERVFGKCRACHKLEDGENATGPYLTNIVNREVGAASGFAAYSGALNDVADTWSVENLYNFVENPRGFAPGTTMGFAGLKKPADRANLIAYLATFGQ